MTRFSFDMGMRRVGISEAPDYAWAIFFYFLS
jgi:hypothetical protein